MENRGIVNIQIKNLYPHPDNPRKDVGDVTELAESIKKSGIMQNLTVIPLSALDEAVDKQTEADKVSILSDFFVLIGHRRLAAAGKAGLTEVPCKIISKISKKEQVGIMLEENMQREDLTIYEQAQGFQMMLDLGETEDGIAEKTGFSRSTIRRRLNIAKLDLEELQKKEKDDSFQMTLKDLYELEKVKDVDVRNRILKEANSSREISWKVQSAVAEEKRNKNAEIIIKMLEEKGISPAPASAAGEMYSGKWDIVKDISLDADVPEEIKYKAKSTDVLYYLNIYRDIRIIRKAEKKKETLEDKERKEKDRKKKEIKAIIKEMDARRKEFIRSIISNGIEPVKETEEVKEALWETLLCLGTCVYASNIKRFFTGKHEYECTKEEKAEADKKVEECSMLHQMLILLNHGMENSGEICDWYGKFDGEKANNLMKGYKILERYGWSFEGEESRIMDGTHELYVHEEKDNE